MKDLHIDKHLWMNGGCVGISSSIDDDLTITIGTKYKNGTPIYPDTYRISRNKLSFYPVKRFKKGVPVRVVPIKDLEVVDDERRV